MGQIGIGTVQSELANDQLIINASHAVQRVDTPRWAEDRREKTEKLGQRISTAPSFIAAQLGRCKYGALYLLDRLTSISESIASNGSLDDAQIACLFDYLGVDHVFRNGSQKVPAGSNGPELAAVVEKEKARLTTKLERELNACDLQEQAAARLGIVRFYDQETRNLRGAQTRADRRVKWAYKVLADVRAGVDPATIIDNETGRPIKPDATFPPAAKAAPPPPPPPTSSPHGPSCRGCPCHFRFRLRLHIPDTRDSEGVLGRSEAVLHPHGRGGAPQFGVGRRGDAGRARDTGPVIPARAVRWPPPALPPRDR